MMEINAVKGEVLAKVGSVSVVMSATMEDIAKLSTALGNPAFVVLAQRLMGTEINAVYASLRLFIRRGEDASGPLTREKAVEVAVKAYRLSDNESLQEALSALLTGLMKPAGEQEKNG